MIQPLWEMVCQFLKTLKIELPYYPAISFLGIYQKELKAVSQRDICVSMLGLL